MRLVDIYWLAGMLEGEGCFREHALSANIIFVTTDRDIADRVGSLMQTPVRLKKHQSISPFKKEPLSKKQLYQVVCQSLKARGWMMLLYSIMGNRRKQKIKEILLAWRNRKTVVDTQLKKGHLPTAGCFKKGNKPWNYGLSKKNLPIPEAA